MGAFQFGDDYRAELAAWGAARIVLTEPEEMHLAVSGYVCSVFCPAEMLQHTRMASADCSAPETARSKSYPVQGRIGLPRD